MNTGDLFYRTGQPHTRGECQNRRQFLQRAGAGFGAVALAALLDQIGLLKSSAAITAAPGNPLQARPPHFAPRAKSVIWCFMNGGPSGIDLFDPKPELDRCDGLKMENKGPITTFSKKIGPLMKSPFRFEKYGECGHPVSEVYSHIGKHVDDIAFIKACHHESNVHDQALFQTNTGMTRLGHPSAGSWVTYGLGSENQNLPGFIVMHDPRGMPVSGPPLWSSGFLPNAFQGTIFHEGANPIMDLRRPAEMSEHAQRRQLDFIAEMNARHQAEHPAEADLLGRISSFELAYRMQMAAPEAVDLARESEATKQLYGMDRPESRAYGSQLLMARRLVERGARFIQAYSGGAPEDWDAHESLALNHRKRGLETDIPIAGLLSDLKRRGLLDTTLVIWGGEFGRLPITETKGGRDHNPHGFLLWMAGGGVKGGISVGETDEVGYRAADDPVSINDVHATILALLGLDHTKLTYLHNGREFRLTDVSGEVIRRMIA
jgi:hypothetical protein